MEFGKVVGLQNAPSGAALNIGNERSSFVHIAYGVVAEVHSDCIIIACSYKYI